MSWQSETFDALRDREWHKIGDLFDAVMGQIPLHNAMRHVMRPKYGRAEFPTNNEARWRLFLSGLANIGIEADGDRGHRLYTDRVRLRYVSGKLCEQCGGPVIKQTWTSRTSVVCLACTAPPPVVVEPEPPPRVRRQFPELALLPSLKDIWNAFTQDHLDGGHLFEDNRKLGWTLRQAVYAGAANEHMRMSLFPQHEYQALGHPTFRAIDYVIFERAGNWVKEKTPALTAIERENWAGSLSLAFHFGALTIVSMKLHGGFSPLIRAEMDALVSKFERQRPRAPLKKRWLAPAKNNRSRWRVR